MVDSNYPNGLVVTDELELIRQHPEYLELSSEPPEKQAKLTHIASSDTSLSAVNTPIVTDIGSEGESQAGQESAQRSPAFASPALSPDDDKDVDDLEDDILGGMEVKPAQPGTDYCKDGHECKRLSGPDALLSACAVRRTARTSYKTDPAYLRLLPIRDKLQKSLRDAERDVSEYSAKVTVNSNIVVMVRSHNRRGRVACASHRPTSLTHSRIRSCALQKRVKQLLETAQTQRDEIAAELDKVRAIAMARSCVVERKEHWGLTWTVVRCLVQIKKEISDFESS